MFPALSQSKKMSSVKKSEGRMMDRGISGNCIAWPVPHPSSALPTFFVYCYSPPSSRRGSRNCFGNAVSSKPIRGGCASPNRSCLARKTFFAKLLIATVFWGEVLVCFVGCIVTLEISENDAFITQCSEMAPTPSRYAPLGRGLAAQSLL